MKKIILFLHSGGNQIRGTEFTLLSLINKLDNTLYSPIVICDNQVLLSELKLNNIECHLHEFPEFMLDGDDRSFPFVKYVKAWFWLLKLCRKQKVSLLYSNGGRPCQLGVPLKIILKIPLICQFHHPAPKRYYYFWLVKYADKVIFPSKFTASHSKQKVNLEGDVIYNGIDNVGTYIKAEKRDSQYRDKLNILPDDVVFTQVGFIGEYKGVGLVLDAFEEVYKINPKVKMLFIGEGPVKEKYTKIAKERNLSSVVRFLGYVDSVVEYFQHVTDVNILASNEEGLGLVLLQASACGLPNIGTDGTGIKEAVIHNKTGFLFEENNKKQLIDYMLRFASSSELRKEMAVNGVKMVDENFSERLYVRKIQSEISKQLSNI